MTKASILIQEKNEFRLYRKGRKEDIDQIKDLYKATAAQNNGISRKPDEITDKYINKIVLSSVENGIIMLAEENNKIIGSVHAIKPEQECFSHILSDLTFVIHPGFQGKGLGKALFGAFMQEIQKNMPEIQRIELFVRSSNERAVKLYESFAFEKEGFLRQRIKNADGIPETDVVMGWIRPN